MPVPKLQLPPEPHPSPAAHDLIPNAALLPPQPLWMRIGRKLQPWVNRRLAKASLIPDRPVYHTSIFPWVAMLEANWMEIRREAAAVLHDLDMVPPLATVSPDHRDIAPADKWRSFFLYGYGYGEEANIRRCPRTDALLRQIPGMNSAFFSVLAPGTFIPPHEGVTKAILTCHLGIRVPREATRCTMRVADEIVHWQAGKALIFDDTYEHEVLNDTDEVRVVLLIHFRRPVKSRGRIVGGLFLWAVRRSRFVQEARRSVREWTARK